MASRAPLPPWTAPAGAARTIVAVDVGSLDEALRLRDRLGEAADFFKIGKELFTAAGPVAVREFTAVGRVFLDLKYHDIPATVAGATRAAAGLGVSIVNAHASGGRAMLRAAADALAVKPDPPHSTGSAATPQRSVERPLLLAVTVLTHLDPEAAAEVLPGASVSEQVVRLSALAASAGADGVVASPLEIEAVRKAQGDDFVVLTPGVRPAWASGRHDQRRVATPGDAARRGANYIVVGRAITESDDPRGAALRIQDEVERASG